MQPPMIPEFNMAGRLDFAPISNALGRWQQQNNQDRSFGLQERQFGEGQRQFNASNALAQSRFGEEQRQFGMNYGLRKDELQKAREQFGMSYGLDKARLALSQDEAKERRIKEFDQRAGGIAQMIASDPNPESATNKWQRLVDSDPRWEQSLRAAGINPGDYRAGTAHMMAISRGYKEPEGYKTVELDADKRLIGVHPKTGETRTLVDASQGGMKPKDSATITAELRKEYASNAKPYFDTRDAFSRIEESAKIPPGQKEPSAAADISLIFNYMKMLDPGSVVREGEFATAQNAGGVDQRVLALYNRMINGGRLTPQIRNDFVSQATGLHQRAADQYGKIQRQYNDIATRTGVDPRNVIIDYSQPGAGGAPVRVSTPDEARRLPKGTQIVLPDGTLGVVP